MPAGRGLKVGSTRPPRTAVASEPVAHERLVPAADPGLQEARSLFHSALLDCLASRSSNDEAGSARAPEGLFLTSLWSLHGLNELLERQTRRIAHELHDEAGQMLSAVYLAVDRLTGDLPPDLRHRTVEIRALLDRIQDQVRRLSHELGPTILDDLGLIPALKFLCEGVSSRSGRSGLRIDLEGSELGDLPPRVEMTLYRTIQEALHNAARHARASHVVIRIGRSSGRIRCSIRDDGIGFDHRARRPQGGQRGLGLRGIDVRLAAVHGTLRIKSAAGRGTELVVTIPLEVADAAESAAGG